MILGGKVINPGELRTPITLKLQTITKDAGGFQKKEPGTTLATVKCRWQNVHGSEVWAADAAQAGEPATLLMRYRSDVNETCYVVKSSNVYEIVSIDNIEERCEYMEIKVKRWVVT